MLGLNRSSVGKIVKMNNDRGTPIVRKSGHRAARLNDEQVEVLLSVLDDDCTLTLRQLQAVCVEKWSLVVSQSAISRYLREFHYTLKKVDMVPFARVSATTIELRYQYARNMCNVFNEHRDSIFFLDEAGFQVGMRSKRGWSEAGERSTVRVQSIRTRNHSVCAVIGTRGYFMYEYKHGAYKGADFVSFLERLFAKFVQEGHSNVYLVMDNASIHKTQVARNLALLHGVNLVYLPPYSPYLNPIENSFSKWKQLVRAAKPTSETHLFSLLETTHTRITPQDCANYYTKAASYFPACFERLEVEY